MAIDAIAMWLGTGHFALKGDAPFRGELEPPWVFPSSFDQIYGGDWKPEIKPTLLAKGNVTVRMFRLFSNF